MQYEDVSLNLLALLGQLGMGVEVRHIEDSFPWLR